MPAPPLNLGMIGRVTRRVTMLPVPFLTGALLLAIISVGWAALSLEFKSDRSDLISPEADFHRRWLEYCERFRETNELIILLEGGTSEQIATARNWIVAELEARNHLFENVMVHSSLQQWQQQREGDISTRVSRLENQYRLTQAILHEADQSTPLQTLIALAGHEVTQNENFVMGKSERAQISALLPRTLAVFEQNLKSIDYSFESLIPEKKEAPADFWQEFIVPSEIEQYSRSSMVDTGSNAELPDVEKGQQDRETEIISVVPIVVRSEDGGEKYGINLQTLESILKAVRQRDPHLFVGATGIPQLEYEEMARSQDDMLLSSILSLSGVIILLAFGFRGFWLPVACCVTLACGMAWSLGATTILVGHLNILSMAFAAILVGLGIDFSIHLMSSYQEFRQAGLSVPDAMGAACDRVGTGIITAAITTAVAFLCAGLTEFPGVAELGIIAGVGVLLCALGTFFVFPALVSLLGQRVDNEIYRNRIDRKPTSEAEAEQRSYWTKTIRRTIAQKPVPVLCLVWIPICIWCWQAWDWDQQGWHCRVTYDANLLNMQPRNLPSVDVQEKLQLDHESDLLYAVTWYGSREQAQQKAAAFRQLATVGRVVELASEFRLQEQEQMLGRLDQLMEHVEQLGPPPLHNLPHNPAVIGQQLEQILALLEKLTGISETQLRLQLDHFLETYAQQPFEIQIQILEFVERDLLRNLWSEIRIQLADLQQTVQNQRQMGELLSARYLNEEGDWLIQIYPRHSIWEDAPLAEFVQEIRQVDAAVTGTPIQNYEAGRQLKNSYLNAAAYAALAIVLVVLIDGCRWGTILFSSFISAIGCCYLFLQKPDWLAELASTEWLSLALVFVACVTLLNFIIDQKQTVISMLALLPPVIGAGLLLGAMEMWAIPFTPANLIALPLVMGIGIDDGVHVLHDFHRAKGNYRMSANTWRALSLTSLTSMIGFGSLALAAHRGLAGLGLVVVIGIASCLLISLVVLPALLALMQSAITEQEDQRSTENSSSGPVAWESHVPDSLSPAINKAA